MITNLERWGNSHRPGFLDIFRFFLGAFITYKGLYFITHMQELEMTTAGINEYFAGMTLAHYVVIAHILGGPLIFFGLFTRIVCLIQLPILIGAVFLVNAPKGFLSIGAGDAGVMPLTAASTRAIFGSTAAAIASSRSELGISTIW